MKKPLPIFARLRNAGDAAVGDAVEAFDVQAVLYSHAPACPVRAGADPCGRAQLFQPETAGDGRRSQQHAQKSGGPRRALEGAAFDDVPGIVIPEGVRNIDEGEFCDPVELLDLAIPYGVTAIGDGAFARCDRLAKVTIPGTVTAIGDKAFYDCYSLTDVVLPDSVTSIGDYAFADCNQLAGCTGKS